MIKKTASTNDQERDRLHLSAVDSVTIYLGNAQNLHHRTGIL